MGDLFFKLRVLRYLLSGAYEEWRTSVWQRDLDSTYCCDGRECGCAASSVREVWSWLVTPTPERKSDE
jgi:hypothetical protein